MADIINLRQARKQRDRAKAARQAETNRALFGRTKAERLAQQAEAMRKDKAIDGARLDHQNPTITDQVDDHQD